ncbi:hypothetical protein B0O99DRAFT_276459 [Bisporella sp. PMI_857]|nr:hypothetical protein B0O99DRAFT_276459 [Bisporella sp. PMI_857]
MMVLGCWVLVGVTLIANMLLRRVWQGLMLVWPKTAVVLLLEKLHLVSIKSLIENLGKTNRTCFTFWRFHSHL